MKLLDEKGIGTVWSICKEKFALVGHTHNSLTAVGSEQISATTYGSGLHFKPYYNSGGPTTYGNILEYTSTNTGGGQLAMEWTGSQTESDGTDSHVGRVYYRSKRDNMNGWTKWMTLAYTNDIPTKLSQLTNDKGFVTGSVSGNTVTINGVSTTWTNTWRGIQDNLTSSSTSESLSANQGKVLKEFIDSKANFSDLFSYSQKDETVKEIYSDTTDDDGVTARQEFKVVKANDSQTTITLASATQFNDGIMLAEDKSKLDGIAYSANNYTLPTASDTTLGGIKVSANANGSSWPICIDDNGLAETKILGLEKHGNAIKSIAFVGNINKFTRYAYNTIDIDCGSGNDKLISLPSEAGTLALTSDIPTKTSQLTNDSTFLTSADKYTLPVASDTTLGGVKTSCPYTPENSWPIYIDPNNKIYTRISGLGNNKGSIESVIVYGDNYYTEYSDNRIIVDAQNPNSKTIKFPSKSGTLALLSDIPDVSSLCRFNFVNNISDCESDRINFLLGFTGKVDLNPLSSCSNGTVLLMVTSDDQASVVNTSGSWSVNMEDYTRYDSSPAYKGYVYLATVRNTKIFFLKLC